MSPDSPNFAWTSKLAQSDLAAAGYSVCPAGTSSAGLYAPYCNFMNDYGPAPVYRRRCFPNPQYNASESCSGICNPFDLNGAAAYNGMQAQLLKRFTNGLSVLSNYTFAKSMSNTDSGFAYANYGSLNKFNQRAEWTVSAAEQTNIVNVATVYELPFGPGKPFLHDGGLLGKNIWGGLQISGALQYATGTPTTVFTNSSDPLLNGFNRANFNPATRLTSSRSFAPRSARTKTSLSPNASSQAPTSTWNCVWSSSTSSTVCRSAHPTQPSPMAPATSATCNPTAAAAAAPARPTLHGRGRRFSKSPFKRTTLHTKAVLLTSQHRLCLATSGLVAKTMFCGSHWWPRQQRPGILLLRRNPAR